MDHLTALIKRDGNLCHYCKVETKHYKKRGTGQQRHERNNKTPNLATKDHIVPKSMGGLGNVENYVLACKKCNEQRGDNLYYCACSFCTSVVDSFMQRIFGGTFGVVKPRVWKHHDRWVISVGLNSFYRRTWANAMRAVPSHEKVNSDA